MMTIIEVPYMISYPKIGGNFMEKICTFCKKLLSLDLFGNDKRTFDKKNQKCKKCCKERSEKTIHSPEAIAKKNAYKAEWQRKKRPILNARLREYYKNNIEKVREQGRERQKRYLQTDKGKKTHQESSKRWKENNIEKYDCHQKVKIALKSGKLIKPEFCQICKKHSDRIEGHHEDYKKPLEVIWMCNFCHLYHHQRDRFHADRLSEKTSKEDAIVRSGKETTRGRSEEVSPPSKDG